MNTFQTQISSEKQETLFESISKMSEFVIVCNAEGPIKEPIKC